MNIRSELRIAWFIEAYLKNPGAGLQILGTGAGRMGYLEQMSSIGRFHYSRLASLQEQQHDSATPICWNMVKDSSHDVAIGWYSLANEQILELILHKMAHVVKPGGQICLTVSQEAGAILPEASTPADAEWLTSLATRNGLMPLHTSLNLAPLGAAPAWYAEGATDLLLVAQKPLHWEDTSFESKDFSCTMETETLCEKFVPKNMQPWATKAPLPEKSIPTNALGRLNYLAQRYEAVTYLELNTQPGVIFSQVQTPVKVLVCPQVKTIPPNEQTDNITAIPLNSEDFFTQLSVADSPLRAALSKQVPSLCFDIIFINGKHTFSDSLHDFTSSLAYAHANTLFVLNASVPCDPYSALPNKKQALAYRRAAGIEGNAWHGDVFKTVFAIHDLFPQYSYCTLTGISSQTIIWQAAREKREPLFHSLEHISSLGYFDMLQHAAALMPVDADMLPKLIGKALAPCHYARPNTWKKLMSTSAR